MSKHAFDRAMALEPDAQRLGHFRGTTSPAYWNMVGPFGGTTAALALQAVLQHPQRLGAPIALTVNYAAAMAAGAFEIIATPVRTNRSTQHWTLQIAQADADGQSRVNTTATAVTALRRSTWGATDLPMPAAPPPSQVERLDNSQARLPWLEHYETRPVSGALPFTLDGAQEHSESCLWLREAPPRALDFPALAALSDMFYPRIYLRRAKRVPIGTVSMTTYFHTDADQLAGVGSGYLLGRAVGQRFYNGFFDQAAQLWSQAGALLATSNQIVYFKE